MLNLTRCQLAWSLLALLALPNHGLAEQFVLFDVTFTYTKEDADNSKPSKSHFYVKDKLINADRPKDWTSPSIIATEQFTFVSKFSKSPQAMNPQLGAFVTFPTKGKKKRVRLLGNGCLH